MIKLNKDTGNFENIADGWQNDPTYGRPLSMNIIPCECQCEYTITEAAIYGQLPNTLNDD